MSALPEHDVSVEDDEANKPATWMCQECETREISVHDPCPLCDSDMPLLPWSIRPEGPKRVGIKALVEASLHVHTQSGPTGSLILRDGFTYSDEICDGGVHGDHIGEVMLAGGFPHGDGAVLQ